MEEKQRQQQIEFLMRLFDKIYKELDFFTRKQRFVILNLLRRNVNERLNLLGGLK